MNIEFNALRMDGRDCDMARGSFSGGAVFGGEFTGGRTMVSMLREERATVMDLEALGRESSTGRMKVMWKLGWR